MKNVNNNFIDNIILNNFFKTIPRIKNLAPHRKHILDVLTCPCDTIIQDALSHNTQ